MRRPRTAGTHAARIGTIGVVTPAGEVYGALTTPDPVELHRIVDRVAGEGVTHLALERRGKWRVNANPPYAGFMESIYWFFTKLTSQRPEWAVFGRTPSIRKPPPERETVRATWSVYC